MTTLLAAVLLASIAGSLHCAGMCGGLVVFYSGTDASRGLGRLIVHATYSGARLIGYALLGALAGAVGSVLNLAGSLAGVQRIAMPIAGAVMILWGLGAIARIRGFKVFPSSSRPGPITSVTRNAFALVAGRPPVVRAVAVGLLSALLPCGWLWAFVITAAGTASMAGGAAVMAAFWLGTVPILLAIGFGAQALALPFRRHAPMVTAILLVAIGVVAVVRRPVTTLAILPRLEAVSPVTASERVGALDSEEMPCCQGEHGGDTEGDTASNP